MLLPWYKFHIFHPEATYLVTSSSYFTLIHFASLVTGSARIIWLHVPHSWLRVPPLISDTESTHFGADLLWFLCHGIRGEGRQATTRCRDVERESVLVVWTQEI